MNHAARMAISFVAVTALGACGSDDGSSADTDAVCENFIAFYSETMAETATPDSANAQLDAAIDAADDELATTLTELKAVAQPLVEDAELMPPEEFFTLLGQAFGWVGDNCDVETLSVSAVDYGFEGDPDEVPAGYTVATLANTGTEQHEMAVVRINDGVTESVDELLALPEEESSSKVTFVGAAFAPPGAESPAGIDLSEPGRYVMLCFIPVGSVGDAEGDGPPHFTEGMIHEFTVS